MDAYRKRSQQRRREREKKGIKRKNIINKFLSENFSTSEVNEIHFEICMHIYLNGKITAGSRIYFYELI